MKHISKQIYFLATRNYFLFVLLSLIVFIPIYVICAFFVVISDSKEEFRRSFKREFDVDIAITKDDFLEKREKYEKPR